MIHHDRKKRRDTPFPRTSAAQALIAVVIVMAIVFGVGAGVLFHSRAFLETTSLQVDADQAYALGKSGLEIIGEAGKCVTSLNGDYDAGEGKNIHVEVSRAYAIDFSAISGNVTSVGTAGKSMRFFEGTDSYTINGWARAYGVSGSEKNDNLYSLAQSSDAGYILGGDSVSFPGRSTEALVVKTNYYGDITWANIYGGSASVDTLRMIIQTNNGDYAFCGSSDINGASYLDDYLLVKTASNGTLTWAKTYGYNGASSDYCTALQQTSDAGYILGGYFWSPFWSTVVKTDSNGTTSWVRLYGSGASFVKITSVRQTTDGGYILGGETDCNGTNNFLVLKTDSVGIAQDDAPATGWHFIYGSTGDDKLSCLQQTADGYILGGTSNSLRSNYDFYVIKIDTVGAVQWAYQYGVSSGNEALYSLKQSADGSFLLGGTTTAYGSVDFLYVKIDSAGVVKSSRRYRKNFPGWDSTLRSLSLTNDDGYALGGDRSPDGLSHDFFLIKNNGTTDALDLDCCSVDSAISVVRTDMTVSTFQLDPETVDGSPYYDGYPLTGTYSSYGETTVTSNIQQNPANLPSAVRACPE